MVRSSTQATGIFGDPAVDGLFLQVFLNNPGNATFNSSETYSHCKASVFVIAIKLEAIKTPLTKGKLNNASAKLELPLASC